MLASTPAAPARADDTPAPNDAPGVYAYIPAPALDAVVAPRDRVTYAIAVYATIDETAPVTITIDIDPRAVILGGLAWADNGDPVHCGVFFERVTCRGTIKRWQPVTVNVFAVMPPDADCIPIIATARAYVHDLTAKITRAARVGSPVCYALPMVVN